MKIASLIVRRAIAGGFAIALAAAGGCGGTVRTDGPTHAAPSADDRADDRYFERVEAMAVRAAIDQGKDYADALSIGRMAADAARAAKATH